MHSCSRPLSLELSVTGSSRPLRQKKAGYSMRLLHTLCSHRLTAELARKHPGSQPVSGRHKGGQSTDCASSTPAVRTAL